MSDNSNAEFVRGSGISVGDVAVLQIRHTGQVVLGEVVSACLVAGVLLKRPMEIHVGMNDQRQMNIGFAEFYPWASLDRTQVEFYPQDIFMPCLANEQLTSAYRQVTNPVKQVIAPPTGIVTPDDMLNPDSGLRLV